MLGFISVMRPMTVRQVFYQATVRGIVEKTERGYCKVQTDLVQMRREGVLPYGWLTDNTRFLRNIATFDSIGQALEDTARLYRKSLWSRIDAYVQVWIEKDALSGVISPITNHYNVDLAVARGYASLSFLHEAAEIIAGAGVPTFVYHLGDYDPSGVNAGEKIERTLREMAPDAEIHFERLAVTNDQISAWSLPTRPTKTTDTRAKKFGPVSVELDAIEPDKLRALVRLAIERHLPANEMRVLKIAEESERQTISRLVKQVSEGMPWQ